MATETERLESQYAEACAAALKLKQRRDVAESALRAWDDECDYAYRELAKLADLVAKAKKQEV
jgi:hypothetical protein